MKFHALGLITLLLVSCSDSESPESIVSKNSISDTVKLNATNRQIDLDRVQHGQQLYSVHCAECHGKQAESIPDWQKPGSDGKYPPPPLNGTGHAWHHSQSVLHKVIKDGTLKIGGSMPAWKDKLSDEDITDIIEWIKANWPDKTYEAWQHRTGALN